MEDTELEGEKNWKQNICQETNWEAATWTTEKEMEQ